MGGRDESGKYSKADLVPKTASTFSARAPGDAHYTASKAKNGPPVSATDLRPSGQPNKEAQARSKPSKRVPTHPLKRGKTTNDLRHYPVTFSSQSIVTPLVPKVREEPFLRTVEVDGPGRVMRTLRVKQEKSRYPGWLRDLNEYELRGVMGIRDVLTGINDPYEIVKYLSPILSWDLKLPISGRMICGVLSEMKRNSDGFYSFPEFLLFMGNPAYLKKKRSHVPEKGRPNCDEAVGRCKQAGDNRNCSLTGFKTRPTDGAKVDPDRKESAYSEAEQLLWSGLLIFQMYETLQGVESLYFNDWIPPSADRTDKLKRHCGFGPNDVGFKKIGTAEWDRPLPPLPKLSPYLYPHNFVTTRWDIKKPNQDEKGRRRTNWQVQPMHLVIEPPRKTPDPIKITENRKRIRAALTHLAEQGDVVALLPDVEFVIHLSDTFIDKLETVTAKPSGSEPKKAVSHNNDLAWIAREIKVIYRPHGLPDNINRLRHMIRYTDGIELRKICNHIRASQWGFVSNKKLEFREEAWARMHVDDIPVGRLRDSFIYSFVTYLPYVSHLPIHHTPNNNPL